MHHETTRPRGVHLHALPERGQAQPLVVDHRRGSAIDATVDVAEIRVLEHAYADLIKHAGQLPPGRRRAVLLDLAGALRPELRTGPRGIVCAVPESR